MGYWENKGVSLRATGSGGGRILSQQGGFQVSELGEQGNKGNKGIRGTRGTRGTRGLSHVHTMNCTSYM
jgi:hypothetical protein